MNILQEYDLFTREQVEKMKKSIKRVAYTVLPLFILLFIGRFIYRFLTEYIWMDSLGFSTVFTTIFWTKIILGLSGFVLFFVSTYITLHWILKAYVGFFPSSQLPSFILQRKRMIWVLIGISLLIGLIGSSIVQGLGWEPLLKLLNYENFGTADPHFGIDISFYVFILPFIKFILGVLLGLTIFYLLIVLGAYSVFHMYRRHRSAQIHIGVTLIFIGLLLAAQHALAPFETLFTNSVNVFQTSVVHGLSFTDQYFNIPKSYVLAGVAIIGTIWMVVAIFRGRMERAFIVPIVYIALIILGQFGSLAVQNFIVSPNELTRETPFLERNQEFTREAYGLNDIVQKEHPGNVSLDRAMVERNRKTIDNIRINDTLPLLEVYNSQDTIRTYYNFHDVDVDRYYIDGEYEQVFVGARELNVDNLQESAQTWVNRYLRYTHGYGVVMSHVNDVTPQGLPQYMIKDIPPRGIIDVTRPQIYFGEGHFPNVIGNSKYDEFDYPSGSENVSTKFDADTGIPMTTLNRVLFAIKEKSFRMLFSDQLTEESQYLETRNIQDRVNRIAPFFEYDNDPYIVIREDGSLAWIIDAYVTAERYPYSEPYSKDKNYIRNSVKVVIDAYSGEVNFYIVDEEDPVINTYKKMFPDLFTEEVPADIQAHFRYPEVLFTIQAKMYGTYHMENLEVFYNREDYWEFPTEKYYDQDIEMRPYYITMKLPDSDEEEFILMLPYTPKNRQNMIAWIGVRNDGEHYGEMFVHRFPKQKNIYGPQQIENRINQDSYISQQLNLWSQGGSKVIRGNLLAIPIEDTVFYVEPIYIQSSNETSLPEVKQIIIAYGQHIVMQPTFEEALDEILYLVERDGADLDAGDSGDISDEGSENEDTNIGEQDEEDTNIPPLTEDAEQLLQEIADLFNRYQRAMGDGKWEEAGRIMSEIERRLQSVSP